MIFGLGFQLKLKKLLTSVVPARIILIILMMIIIIPFSSKSSIIIIILISESTAEGKLSDILQDKLREKRSLVNNDDKQSVDSGRKIVCNTLGCAPEDW